MIRLAIHGARGRMGRKVVALAAKDSRFDIVAAIERPGHPDIGADCGVPAGIGELGVPIAGSAADFDVLVDFSAPDGVLSAIDMARENRASLVSGTTGLGDRHFAALREASREIGVFVASNFGRGIAALAEITGSLARIFPGADIEIIETHHGAKLDSPSGTALGLAKRIVESRGTAESIPVYGRHGHTGPRPSGEIGIHSVRGGDIVGEHSVIFALPHETLIVEHRAISRDLFARGALEAAAFVAGKIGYFEMKDLIGTFKGA